MQKFIVRQLENLQASGRPCGRVIIRKLLVDKFGVSVEKADQLIDGAIRGGIIRERQTCKIGKWVIFPFIFSSFDKRNQKIFQKSLT